MTNDLFISNAFKKYSASWVIYITVNENKSNLALNFNPV